MNNTLIRELEPNRNVIKHDKFDKLCFSDILTHNLDIRDNIHKYEKDYPTFIELYQDAFNLLYKHNPEFYTDDLIEYKYLINKEILSNLISTDSYKKLREFTKLDKIASTVGFKILSQELNNFIESFIDKLKDLDDSAQSIKTLTTGVEKISLEDLKKKIEEFKKEIKNSFGKKEKILLETTLKKSLITVTNTSNLISSVGLNSSNTSYAKGGYQEKLNFLSKMLNSEKLKKLAEMAGKFRHLAISLHKEKLKYGSNEVYDITQGDNIQRLLPSEFMKLGDEFLSLLMEKDYIEKKLFQYSLESKEKKARGPIIVAIDESYSMNGLPEVFSKAVALGLLEICRMDKRIMHVIHYDDSPKEILPYQTFNFKHLDSDYIIEMCETFLGHGTLFEPPLELAMDKINSNPEVCDSDIIFITDGNSAVTNEWLENFLKWKKDKKVKILSVLIDAYDNSDSALKEFSDKILTLSSIDNTLADETAEIIFRAM